MKTCVVKCIRTGNRWYSQSDDELCITLEDSSLDRLKEKVCLAAPRMLELNCGYIGEVELVFEIEGK